MFDQPSLYAWRTVQNLVEVGRDDKRSEKKNNQKRGQKHESREREKQENENSGECGEQALRCNATFFKFLVYVSNQNTGSVIECYMHVTQSARPHQHHPAFRLFIIPPAEVATRAMLSRIARVSYASRLLTRRYATKPSKASTKISTVTSPSSFWAQTFKKVTGPFPIPHDSQGS
jgi:hypothetical protein